MRPHSVSPVEVGPRRVRPRGVSILEVWNRPLPDGALFWEAAGLPRLEALRADGSRAPGEVIGRALREALLELQREGDITTVFLGGGLLLEPGVSEALADIPIPIVRADDPVFVGVAGGAALLAAAGHREGVVIDIGQTAAKARAGGRAVVIPRDLERLPRLFIDPGRRPGPSAARRDHFATMACQALDAVREGRVPEAIVLALPCPLTDSLVPGGSTYGVEGDAELVPEVCRAIGSLLSESPGAPYARTGGAARVPLLVLNDAELAAESARQALGPAAGARVLCLTLGFGPGAALLEA